MLKNTFRKAIGLIILGVFGLAVFQYARITSDNPYAGGALAFGFKVLLFLALVLWVIFLVDRRVNKRQQ